MAYYAIGNPYVIKARLPPSYFDASGSSNKMFDELAKRPLMSPLAGMKHTHVRLAIVIFSHIHTAEEKFDSELVLNIAVCQSTML